MKTTARNAKFLKVLYLATLLLASFQSLLAQAPPGVTFLHVFDGGSSGANPVTSVVQTPDFSLAGVAFGQEQFATTGGVLYTVSPTGKFTVLHQFPASGKQGGLDEGKYASIMQASDQNFYGTFSIGGTGGDGAIYRVTPTGVYTQIHGFSGPPNEGKPLGPLVQAFDGNLYGVTEIGPNQTLGSIFRVGLDGSYSEVYAFNLGYFGAPSAGLILGPDGNLYGLSTGGSIYSFNPATSAFASLFLQPQEFASSIPVLGHDSRLYFTSTNANICACPYGAILSFGLDGSGPEFPFVFGPGGYADTNLTLAGDGSFYSYYAAGGSSSAESVNVATQTAAFYSLAGIGSSGNNNFTQLSNGEFAGTTYLRGYDGNAGGTLFLLNTGAAKPAPFILGFEPQAASPGQTVTVWGSSFVGTTAVTLDGIPAQFKIAASGFLSFTVPAGIISAAITITNAGGSATSTGILSVQ